MKRSVIFILAFALFTCKQEDVSPKQVAQFFIDYQKESAISSSVGAAESCGSFILNSIDFKNTLPVYNLSIQLLKSGRLVHVLLNTKEGRRFETHRPNPEKYVTISNFKHDTLAQTISFDIGGKLFIMGSSGVIDISGRFENISAKSYGCLEFAFPMHITYSLFLFLSTADRS
jgi:hypothetical protein